MPRVRLALASSVARARILARDVVDLFYPTTCAFCFQHTDARGPLCPACADDLARQEAEAACPACGKPLAAHGDPCPYCEGSGEPNFERVVRLGAYADPIRHLIYRAKFHGHWSLAEFFADRLMQREPVRALLTETDCLVPIPLHRLRQMSRGYNQSDVLARRLGKLAELPVVRPLERIRHTDAQIVVKSRTKREENLRDAFALVDPKAMADRHVVLIDDVMTTGATLQSAARAIKPAKPASLSVIVVSIADPRGRDFEVI